MLLASGYVIEEDARRRLAAGAAGFLDKPYAVDKLLLDAAKAMLELGADVDAPSPDGAALDIAKRERKADVVTWLVNRR